MTKKNTPEVLINLCKNCIPAAQRLPAQWTESGLHVRVREVPCSGKIDLQYILHALEGGVQGVCIVACPKGDCTLSQGNYRAEMRIVTAKRLLGEIGLEPGRAELLHCDKDETIDHLKERIAEVTRRFSGLKRRAD
jgi:F420-non-reducing hydrogenase iron-sulfur subunit